MQSVRILSLAEICTVAREWTRRWRKSKSAGVNLVLFRLSACCGLRVSEISGLNVGDVRIASARPHIRVPARIAKRGKARLVPLWWDAATLADVRRWKELRVAQGATDADPFVCSTRSHCAGQRVGARTLQARWKRIIREVLGTERSQDMSIHCGRHTFCSTAVRGKSIADVRDAAGHASIKTTNIYLHVAHDDGEVGNLFEAA